MQVVKHTDDYISASPLLDEIESLYSILSVERANLVKSKLGISPVYNSCLYKIYDMFTEYSIFAVADLTFADKPVAKIQLDTYDPKNIIVCYSGGKDSLSVIMHYKAMGYNVFAYHVRGLNKTYFDEYQVAEKAAADLGFELIVDSVGYSGEHCWVEHPMKNMILANMALSYGIRHKIGTKIAFGNFYSSYLFENVFEICGGDCTDAWETYEYAIQKIIPKFKIYRPNKNLQTAYNYLTKHPEHLPYTISCITPYRFRKQFTKRTENNYKVKLMPNRCGCCWKCATEYLYFADVGVLEYDKKYYLHCIEVLGNTLRKDFGYTISNINIIWDYYMFYPITKSKAYKELKNAAFRSGKIKITSEIIEN